MGPGQEHFAIEIETDSGHVGVCANYFGGALACQIIQWHYRRFLIGADPFNTELIWQQMHRASLPYGLGGLTGMALAGVDIALWDLKGKIVDRPVYDLIGGITKPDGIPCYITTHPDYAAHWKDKGFVGIKIVLGATHFLEHVTVECIAGASRSICENSDFFAVDSLAKNFVHIFPSVS